MPTSASKFCCAAPAKGCAIVVGESQPLIGEQVEARYRNFGPKMVVESAVDVWKIDRQTGGVRPDP